MTDETTTETVLDDLVESFLDQADDEDGTEVVIFEDDEGNALEFAWLAVVEVDDQEYAMMAPIEDIEGGEALELYLFRYDEDEDESASFSEIEDEETYERVREFCVTLAGMPAKEVEDEAPAGDTLYLVVEMNSDPQVKIASEHDSLDHAAEEFCNRVASMADQTDFAALIEAQENGELGNAALADEECGFLTWQDEIKGCGVVGVDVSRYTQPLFQLAQALCGSVEDAEELCGLLLDRSADVRGRGEEMLQEVIDSRGSH
jgi:hypothetical protein